MTSVRRMPRMQVLLQHPGRGSTGNRRSAAATAVAAVAVSALVLAPIGSALAATPVSLGAADSFAVLASTAITNTGTTTVTGDIGASSGSITGAGTMVLTGASANHGNDAATAAAQGGLTAAYGDAGAQGAGTDVGTTDLALQTQPMLPGVYSSGSDLSLTGTITLDGGGSYDSVFVFRAVAGLTTGSASTILLINGAQACNVFWQIGSSATLGSGSSFRGNILAHTSISLDAGATVEGRLLASTGAVTLIGNTIMRPACASGPVATPPSSTPPVPTPPISTPPTSAGPSSPSGTGDASTTGGTTAGQVTHGQVRHVPTGAVDTGDGSTA